MAHDLANINWKCANSRGNSESIHHAILATLMDLREELQKLNRIIGCSNAIDIPNILRRIEGNTVKSKRRSKKSSGRQ